MRLLPARMERARARPTDPRPRNGRVRCSSLFSSSRSRPRSSSQVPSSPRMARRVAPLTAGSSPGPTATTRRPRRNAREAPAGSGRGACRPRGSRPGSRTAWPTRPPRLPLLPPTRSRARGQPRPSLVARSPAGRRRGTPLPRAPRREAARGPPPRPRRDRDGPPCSAASHRSQRATRARIGSPPVPSVRSATAPRRRSPRSDAVAGSAPAPLRPEEGTDEDGPVGGAAGPLPGGDRARGEGVRAVGGHDIAVAARSAARLLVSIGEADDRRAPVPDRPERRGGGRRARVEDPRRRRGGRREDRRRRPRRRLPSARTTR